MNSLRINSLDNYKKNDEIVDVVFDEILKRTVDSYSIYCTYKVSYSL